MENIPYPEQQQPIINDVAAACFLNALARECDSISIVIEGDKSFYCIPRSEQSAIYIPLRYVSSLGLHQYHFPAYALGENNTPLDFTSVLNAIMHEPSLVGLLTAEQSDIFITRVLESSTNTHQAILKNPYGQSLFSDALNFQQAEQGLLVGHSVHPAPKSREQFTADDAALYSPEFGGQFALRWLAVHPSITISGSSAELTVQQRLEEFLEADTMLAKMVVGEIPEGYLLFPVHPWQWQWFKKHRDIIQYLEQGLIEDFGEFGATWYPTSSTRSLYSPSMPYMLKFSLSVKLTNSIRNLSLKEVVRGTRLNQLFHDTDLSGTQGKGRGFQVMQEPAFVGLIDQKGDVIDESLVVFRDNPLQSQIDQEAVVLATLTQQNPWSSASLCAARIHSIANENNSLVKDVALDWFSAYCRHVVVPLFALQANFGVVFLAHQQNIVLQMDNGFPVGMYYRDCQGTGYTDLAFERFSQQLSESKNDVENYWNQEKVRRYFAYYLVINSTFNVISSIASHCDISEQGLLHVLRQHLEALRFSEIRDSACLDYVLDSDTLCCKGNFYCYLQNFNENSIPDPAVIYFDLPNPLISIKEYSHV